MNTETYKQTDEINEFDPMGKHYFSKNNSYVLGPGGDLEPIVKLQDSTKSKTVTAKPKVHVTHFYDGITKQGLKNIFESYGKVENVSIHKSPTGFKFAFVTFDHVDQAMAAIHGLHMRAPHRLHVEFAKEKVKIIKENKYVYEPIILIPKIIYKPPILPLVLSNARRNLRNQNFIEMCTPLKSYNDYALNLITPNKPQHNNEIKKKTELCSKDLTESFEHNYYNAKLCNCANPAAYYCRLCGTNYCSRLCQQKDMKCIT